MFHNPGDSGPSNIFLSCRFICCSYSCLSVSKEIGNTMTAAVETTIHEIALPENNIVLINDFDAPISEHSCWGNIPFKAIIRSMMVSSASSSKVEDDIMLLNCYLLYSIRPGELQNLNWRASVLTKHVCLLRPQRLLFA